MCERERPHPLTHGASRWPCGRSRPHRNFGVAFCALAYRPENMSDKTSDTLGEHERRSPLSILKSPPKQPKAVTIQARVQESVKTKLELYAEFIDASPSYVIKESCVTRRFRRRSICTGRTTAMKHGRRRGKFLPRL